MAMPNATLIVQNGGLLARGYASLHIGLASQREIATSAHSHYSSRALLGSRALQINAVGIATLTADPLFPAKGKNVTANTNIFV